MTKELVTLAQEKTEIQQTCMKLQQQYQEIDHKWSFYGNPGEGGFC